MPGATSRPHLSHHPEPGYPENPVMSFYSNPKRKNSIWQLPGNPTWCQNRTWVSHMKGNTLPIVPWLRPSPAFRPWLWLSQKPPPLTGSLLSGYPMAVPVPNPKGNRPGEASWAASEGPAPQTSGASHPCLGLSLPLRGGWADPL